MHIFGRRWPRGNLEGSEICLAEISLPLAYNIRHVDNTIAYMVMMDRHSGVLHTTTWTFGLWEIVQRKLNYGCYKNCITRRLSNGSASASGVANPCSQHHQSSSPYAHWESGIFATQTQERGIRKARMAYTSLTLTESNLSKGTG